MTSADASEVRYDWSSMPSVLSPEDTAARLAEVERHDRLKAQLDRGHTVRLLLAVPIVILSLALMAIVILAVVIPLLELVGGVVDDFGVDARLALLIAVVVVAEVAAIWSALILIKDAMRARAWLAITVLAAAALAAALAMLFIGGSVKGVDWPGRGDAAGVIWPALIALAYLLVVALTQWRRARRLQGVVAVVERWYP